MRYRFFLLFDALIMSLPRRWRKALFAWMGEAAYRFAEKRNFIIRQNLRFAFGDTLDANQIEAIERYCYRNLALNLLQVMENRRNSSEELSRHVRFENREKVDALLAQQRGIIFVSAHYGNWEIGAAAVAALITPMTSIYKGFDRPEFDPYLFEARNRHRMDLTEKSGAIKHLARALKNNQSVSLMIDQGSNPKYGVPVTFFGHKTYHSSTPAMLSIKYQAPIVPLYIRSDDEEHFIIRFEEPIEPSGQEESYISEATQRQAEVVEKMIRENPKLWFWCHKRWKGEFPELYRRG